MLMNFNSAAFLREGCRLLKLEGRFLKMMSWRIMKPMTIVSLLHEWTLSPEDILEGYIE